MQYKELIIREFKNQHIIPMLISINRMAILHEHGVGLITQRGETLDLEKIYYWTKLEFKYRYIHPASMTEYYTFNLEVRQHDKTYRDLTFPDMVKQIESQTLVGKNKNLLVGLLNLYLDKIDIPSLEMTSAYGFLPNKGWVMSDKHRLIVSNINVRQEFEQRVIRNLEIDIDRLPPFMRLFHKLAPKNHPNSNPKRFISFVAKYWVQSMYEITNIEYKDFMFAFIFGAPFFSALKPVSGINPFCDAHGPGKTGKTSLFNLGACHFYNAPKGLIGGSSKRSLTRLEHEMAMHTFPILIDEADKLPPFYADMLKTALTDEDYMKRYNRDQSTKLDALKHSSLAFTDNTLSSIFRDIAFRTRGLLLPVKPILEKDDEWIEKRDEWKNLRNYFPKGLIMKYLYDATKNWSYNDVVRKYENCSNLENNDYDRGDDVARCFAFGQLIAKEIFDLELDLTKFPMLYRETQRAGSGEIMDLIRTQIREGTNFRYNENARQYVNQIRGSWVKAPIIVHKYKGESGYIFQTGNLKDLNNHNRSSEQFNNLSMDELFQMVNTTWINAIKSDNPYTVSKENNAWLKTRGKSDIRRTTSSQRGVFFYEKDIFDVEKVGESAKDTYKYDQDAFPPGFFGPKKPEDSAAAKIKKIKAKKFAGVDEDADFFETLG